ncbi:MAG TPA: M20/M25/M40 family metallo-hydrolase [Anaerolineales bacterium]|nr:M20/M25/M40 family metallo-hydrolase [Anaerolineales bacterium]
MTSSEIIDQHLQQHLDTYIQELIDLCRQPSVSARKEGTDEMARLVAELLESYGLTVQSIDTPGSPVIVGKLAGKSERTLLFYNHYDVQPPEPLELWTSPPYEPEIREGKLYARGVKDDKGELVARLAAMDAARAANGGELPCGVIFVVEGEEEIGSPYIAEFVQNHLDLLACHGSIWEEGMVSKEGPIDILGRRGVAAFELSVESMAMDAHSGNAHNLPSAAWRLVLALASLKDENERILIPGFYDNALPPTEVDRKLIETYPNLEKQQRAVLENYQIDSFLGGPIGAEAGLAIFNPTCNIQGITTGYQGEGMKTVIPARAAAKLDFRLVKNQDPDDIEEKLRAHLIEQGFEDIQVKRLGAMWPYRADPEDPFVQLSARTAKEVYGKDLILVPTTGGSSPVYAFAGPLGNIPVISPGVGYWDSRTHAPDENMRLEDFHNAARNIARILDGFAEI